MVSSEEETTSAATGAGGGTTNGTGGGGGDEGATNTTTTTAAAGAEAAGNGSDHNNNYNNVDVLESLHRLSLSLQELDDKTLYALSHYRRLPTTLVEAYDILQQGAALIHGTSTKFTLMEKIANSHEQTREMAKNLLQGCELVGTACLVLHERSTGTSTACRHYVKQACRAIVQTVHQLVQTFQGGTCEERAAAHEEDNALGAQRTGAVWQTCNVILEKQMPRGNRNCMRRRLFSYMAECRETLQEFQELINQGPAALVVQEEEEQTKPTAAATKTDEDAEEKSGQEDDDGWFRFLSGQDQLYTSTEIPVATAALALIKISRGAINLTDQACEAVGECLHENDNDNANENNDDDKAFTKKERNEKLLAWMETLHHLACAVGEGMTDLGATLYPPLQLLVVSSSSTLSSSSSSSSPCEVEMQINRQADTAIAPLLDHVLDFATMDASTMDFLPENVVELATKLKENLSIRQTLALEAIVTAVSASPSAGQ